MNEPHYYDPQTGARHALDEPRWCSDARTPLMISPLAGMSRDDIDTRARVRCGATGPRCRASSRPVSMGGAAHGRARPGRSASAFQAGVVQPDLQLQDRGAAVMLSWLRQIGIGAAQAAAARPAIAAFGAAAGMAVTIFAPAYASRRPRSRRSAPSAPTCGWWTGRAKPRRTRPSAHQASCTTPVTGSPSSCRAPSPSPTKCGRTSASRRRTTW